MLQPRPRCRATGITPAVANLSLSGPAGENVDAAIRGLIDDGVTVAVAAGNDDACAAALLPTIAPPTSTASVASPSTAVAAAPVPSSGVSGSASSAATVRP